jgi:hypothetical protein
MEKRCHSRMMLGQFWLSMRTSFVAVTKPLQWHADRELMNDPMRLQAAFSILGRVEVWRIEHGRPTGEPRPLNDTARSSRQVWRNPGEAN